MPAVLAVSAGRFFLPLYWSLFLGRKYREKIVHWLVGCFGFNGPLRQYFSLYRAVSQREGERGERIDMSKNVQTTPTRTYCNRNRPLPYCNQNCRTPQHWKLTQHHRTTRPPPKDSPTHAASNSPISPFVGVVGWCDGPG